MPLGKYYCDYCDKEFQDTAAARRRHLQGVVHKRAKALWYDNVRTSSSSGLNQDQYLDPKSFGKLGICNHFIHTGSCQYGDSCKYYHPKKDTPDINTQAMEGQSSSNSVQPRAIPAYFGSGNVWKSDGNVSREPTSIFVASSGGWVSTITIYRLGIVNSMRNSSRKCKHWCFHYTYYVKMVCG